MKDLLMPIFYIGIAWFAIVIEGKKHPTVFSKYWWLQVFLIATAFIICKFTAT